MVTCKPNELAPKVTRGFVRALKDYSLRKIRSGAMPLLRGSLRLCDKAKVRGKGSSA
jgi:hypothetical protein